MRTRLLVGIFLILFLTGCVTTRKEQDIQAQQLQSRINYLQEELENKNQEISNLENELKRAQSSSLMQKTESKSTHALRLSAREIQTALKNAGFYKGTIDGKMGPRTREAIKEFQKSNGLKADGIVGRRTAEKLNNYLR